MNINIQLETRDGVARVAQIGTWTDPGEDMVAGKAMVNAVWSSAAALAATLQGLIDHAPSAPQFKAPDPEPTPVSKPTPTPAPDPEPAPAKEEPKFAPEDVRKKLTEVRKTKGTEGLQVCFEAVKKARFSDLIEADYPVIMAKAEEVLNAK